MAAYMHESTACSHHTDDVVTLTCLERFCLHILHQHVMCQTHSSDAGALQAPCVMLLVITCVSNAYLACT